MIEPTFFDGVPNSNGYLASFVGVFGEAIEGTDQYRLVTDIIFYEFLEEGEANKDPVFISGTQIGRTYTLIVSTPSGLYRYNTGISVQITGKDPANTFFEIIE